MMQHNLTFNGVGNAGVVPPLPDTSLDGVKILLASNSPRRRELLGMILPAFEIATPRDVDEKYPQTLAPSQVPMYLSQLKANAYSDLLLPNELIITADTIVIADDRILGKPHNVNEAIEMLHLLENATHTVVTGVTLMSLGGKQLDSFSESTKVTFGHLSDNEIETYISRYHPFDKAGAYGIQEWIGGAAIARIDGCFYNVMGLPLHTLYRHLKEFFK